MTLAMTRPWKHPKTGIFWLRKRVPKDLLLAVGRNEEKRSLATRDPVEAKRRLAEALVDVEARWARLRAAPADQALPETSTTSSISEREAHEISRVFYDRYLEMYADNPSSGFWKPEIGQTLWRAVDYKLLWDSPELRLSHDKQREAEAWCADEARGVAAHRGLQLDEASLVVLSRAIGAAVQSASLKLQRLLQGEYDAPPPSPTVPGASPAERPLASPGVPFAKLFDGWQAEKVPGAKTAYTWKRVMDQLGAHLGHTDGGRLTPEDVIGWKNVLVEAGLKGKTIRDGKLAPLRAILQWGVDNRLLRENVAERVTVSVKAKVSQGRRGYTDEEAKAVLAAALKETDPLRRWVPWICAYTGARVAEVCQLRAEDLHRRDGVWFLALAAEAGSLKNANSERALPVHSALLSAGFPAFVAGVKAGPLFADLKPDRFGSRGGNGTKVLSRWVRDQGLKDPRISPNHSWRHRFKTLGRRHGLASDIVDAITGHGRKTVADSYGEFELAALAREIEKIPCLQL